MAEIDPPGNPEPTCLQVADAIAARIKAGHYDRKLPSERDLAAEFNVSYQTQRHATDVLRSRGLIITPQGQGTLPHRRRQSGQHRSCPTIQQRPLGPPTGQTLLRVTPDSGRPLPLAGVVMPTAPIAAVPRATRARAVPSRRR